MSINLPDAKESMIARMKRRELFVGGSAGLLYTLFNLSLPAHAATVPQAVSKSNASRPAMHWGTFTMNHDAGFCQRNAEHVMRDLHGYTIWDDATSNDYLVVGGTDAVIVVAACSYLQANQTYMMIFAASNDSSVAEAARNTIRSDIQFFN